ncbi:MAG: hypothetical protein ACRDLK_06250, partial [Gaiellaceae bacterium]
MYETGGATLLRASLAQREGVRVPLLTSHRVLRAVLAGLIGLIGLVGGGAVAHTVVSARPAAAAT